MPVSSAQEIDINESGDIDKEEFLGWVFQTNNFRDPAARCFFPVRLRKDRLNGGICSQNHSHVLHWSTTL